MEINHRTEKHRTTVERENSPEGSLLRCWLSEVVRRKKMVSIGFHVENLKRDRRRYDPDLNSCLHKVYLQRGD
ncbi:hypothetical protein LXL04_016320 [Taraxacum kok-saghyz]